MNTNSTAPRMRAAAVNPSATPALLRAWVVCSRVAVPSLPEATLPPPRGPARKARGKSLPPSFRDRRRPTEKGPGNSPHTGCQPPPTERISNIGLVLLLSFAGLSNGIADLFFLIMTCVVAIVPAEDHRSGKLRMPVLAVGPFPAGNEHKTCPFQVGDQLANLAWHTRNIATAPVGLPIFNSASNRPQNQSKLCVGAVQNHASQ